MITLKNPTSLKRNHLDFMVLEWGMHVIGLSNSGSFLGSCWKGMEISTDL